MDLELLKRKRDDVAKKLGDAGLLRDPQKLKALSIELGRIEKEIHAFERGQSPAGLREKVFVEIRAGTGGDEAAVVAGELVRMYTNFA